MIFGKITPITYVSFSFTLPTVEQSTPRLVLVCDLHYAANATTSAKQIIHRHRQRALNLRALQENEEDR